jgi:hypothetical protein
MPRTKSGANRGAGKHIARDFTFDFDGEGDTYRKEGKRLYSR